MLWSPSTILLPIIICNPRIVIPSQQCLLVHQSSTFNPNDSLARILCIWSVQQQFDRICCVCEYNTCELCRMRSALPDTKMWSLNPLIKGSISIETYVFPPSWKTELKALIDYSICNSISPNLISLPYSPWSVYFVYIHTGLLLTKLKGYEATPERCCEIAKLQSLSSHHTPP